MNGERMRRVTTSSDIIIETSRTTLGNSSLTRDMMRDVFPTLAVDRQKDKWKLQCANPSFSWRSQPKGITEAFRSHLDGCIYHLECRGLMDRRVLKRWWNDSALIKSNEKETSAGFSFSKTVCQHHVAGSMTECLHLRRIYWRQSCPLCSFQWYFYLRSPTNNILTSLRILSSVEELGELGKLGLVEHLCSCRDEGCSQ